jgi:Ice-binding-like/Putative Ig domain
MTRTSFATIAIAGPLALLCGVTTASAQAAPSTGAAQSYAVLAGTTVAVNGTGSVINGDVGVSPGTAITGIPGGGTVVPPFATHSNDSSAIAAQNSVGGVGGLYTALVNFGGTPASGTPTIPELGNVTLGPGTYIFSSTANIAAGQVLTLSGGGTYVFKVGSSLTANVGSSMLLLNGASPCNVFWQITADATLNGVTFAGTVVAQSSVTLGVGATLSGRALATSLGAVTLSGSNTVGGCSTAGAGCPAITIAPPTLPNGIVGVAYTQTITASGGAAPYTFTVTAGTLPAGLTLTPAGLLAGTPTTASTSTFTVTAVDANGCPASISYTIVIAATPAGCPTINFTPATIPNGTTAVPYSQTFVGSGGTAPYTFGVTSGTLPAGLVLTGAGVLAGTPTTPGPSAFTIRATDANGCFVERAYAMTIAAAVPTLPQTFVMLLAAGLFGIGYLRLRRRAGAVSRAERR